MPAAGVCRTAPAVDAMRAVHAAAAFPEGGRQQTNDRRLWHRYGLVAAITAATTSVALSTSVQRTVPSLNDTGSVAGSLSQNILAALHYAEPLAIANSISLIDYFSS